MENVTFSNAAHHSPSHHDNHDLGYVAPGCGRDGAGNLYRFLNDAGKKILDEREDIVKVNSGRLGNSEVNRMRYDPNKATVEKMEGWLKEAGMYLRTVPIEKK